MLAIFKDLEERSNVVSEKAVELVVEHLAPAEERLVDDGIGLWVQERSNLEIPNFGKL